MVLEFPPEEIGTDSLKVSPGKHRNGTLRSGETLNLFKIKGQERNIERENSFRKLWWGFSRYTLAGTTQLSFKFQKLVKKVGGGCWNGTVWIGKNITSKKQSRGPISSYTLNS